MSMLTPNKPSSRPQLKAVVISQLDPCGFYNRIALVVDAGNGAVLHYGPEYFAEGLPWDTAGQALGIALSNLEPYQTNRDGLLRYQNYHYDLEPSPLV